MFSLNMFVKRFLKRVYSLLVICLSYNYDKVRFINNHFNLKYRESHLSYIIRLYHGIEKGFTMPNFRYGFGEKTIKVLVDEILVYYSKYGEDRQLLHAIEVLSQYKYCHQLNNYRLNKDIDDAINNLLGMFPDIQTTKIQVDKTDSDYFSKRESPFVNFSNSRKSVRNFSDLPVEIDQIVKAISLAQNAPSACNRQPARVRIIANDSVKSSILSLQTGNRGFETTIDKLLILTCYIGGYERNERNSSYIDGGIYLLNLVYSLHFYAVGTCILNWSSSIKRDKKLRRILQIPENEVVIALIACGNVPKSFKVNSSLRFNYNDIILTY